MSAANSRPSGSSLGKNSTVQSQSSSSFQYGSISCCKFIRRPLNLTVQNYSWKLATRRLSRCPDPALMSATPHYGLRYGSAPATGNFQRLRGRPPLVSPLKSCIGRSFTAVTRVQIPSGTPNLFRSLRGTATFGAGTKRHNSVANFWPSLPNRQCFRASGAVLVGTKRHMQLG